MKRKLVSFLCAVVLCWGVHSAYAQEVAPLPASVLALCAETYPDHTISVYSGWGDDRHGQFALALSQDQQHILCIAEKAPSDAGYQFVIENDRALREGEYLPRLLIDTGGDALFYSYIDYGYSYQYSSAKNEAGAWSNVNLMCCETAGPSELLLFAEDGLLRMREYHTDEEGNILWQKSYTPVPVPWLQASLPLESFDITKFPTNPYRALTFGGLQAATDLLLPPGALPVDGCVIPAALSLLADLPDHTRRVYFCEWTAAGSWQVTESSPLPKDAWIDTFHAWDDLSIEWNENGQEVGYTFYPKSDGGWAVRFASATDWFSIGDNVIRDANKDQACYGTLPFGDVRSIDWDNLPRTLADALAMLDTTGWARVTSYVPEDRLHLRTKPSKSAASLGKYYSGTPVQVLEEQGEWAHVMVYGVEGWMMKSFLTFGKDMMYVPVHYPALGLTDELEREGVMAYERPDLNAPAEKKTSDLGPLRLTIIGIVGDDWFHVAFGDTGAAAYIRQDCFWPGNG